MGLLLLLVLLAGIVLALAATSAVSAKRSLEQARTGLFSLQDQDDMDPRRVLPAVSQARAQAVDADGQLDGPAWRVSLMKDRQ